MEKHLTRMLLAASVAMSSLAVAADEKSWLDELPLADMSCGWKSPNKNKSVDGSAIKIGSKTYARGVGTHALSLAIYEVGGKAIAFDADVGLDAEVFPAGAETASVKFSVLADARVVAETEVLKGRRESVHLHADLSGAKIVELRVSDADDGDTWDHADWADAYFTMQDGARPVPAKCGGEQLGILTPKPPASPRITARACSASAPGIRSSGASP